MVSDTGTEYRAEYERSNDVPDVPPAVVARLRTIPLGHEFPALTRDFIETLQSMPDDDASSQRLANVELRGVFADGHRTWERPRAYRVYCEPKGRSPTVRGSGDRRCLSRPFRCARGLQDRDLLPDLAGQSVGQRLDLVHRL